MVSTYLANPPVASAPATAPSQAAWLNDLSSTFPRSVTTPIQNAFSVPQSASVAAFSAVEHALSAIPSRPAAAVTAAIFLNFLNNCAPLEGLVE